MKTKDKICCGNLPPALEAALAESFGKTADFSAAVTGADLALHAAGAAPPAGLSPAVPRLVIDLGTPQRLGSLIRRARQMIDTPAFYLDDIALGPAIFQPQEKTIRLPGQPPTALTDKEVDILLSLARLNGGALKRDDLLRHVWRYQPGVDTHTLETHVYRLRQKLAAMGGLENLLVTDEDGGYRLSVLPAAAPDSAAES